MLVLIPGFDQVAQWISTLITDPNWKAFEETSQKQNEWFLQMSNMPDLLLCILVNALVPAVCEELFLEQEFSRYSWNDQEIVTFLLFQPL